MNCRQARQMSDLDGVMENMFNRYERRLWKDDKYCRLSCASIGQKDGMVRR